MVAKSIDQLLIYIDTQIAIDRLKAEDYSKDLIERAREISNRLAGRSAAKPSHTQVEKPFRYGAAGSPPNTESQKRLQEQLLQLHSLSPQERGFALSGFLARFSSYTNSRRADHSASLGSKLTGASSLVMTYISLKPSGKVSRLGRAIFSRFPARSRARRSGHAECSSVTRDLPQTV